MDGRRARNLELLDALDKLDRIAIKDTVWRVVRNGRDPLLGHPSGGRWDPGQFDVLYTSFAASGAVAEMYFHLSRQPVFPSKIEFSLNQIEVSTQSTLKFADLRELEPLGVDTSKYSTLSYGRTQEIGDAAQFLGFDGIIAPSARRDCLNLIIFSDCFGPDDLEIKGTSIVDWAEWRQKKNS